MSDFTIHTLDEALLHRVVPVHLEAFSGTPGGRLGRHYAMRFLRWFTADRERIALVATSAGEVSGYVVGAPTGYTRELGRHLLPSVIGAFLRSPWLILDRSVFSKLATRLRGMLRKRGSVAPTADMLGRSMSLVAIGIARQQRRSGIASALIAAFEAAAKERSMERVRLSVYSSNQGARRLYESCGWKPIAEQPASLSYSKEL
jgi:ribosomal protein S18 acetylase RimI-like enzyme